MSLRYASAVEWAEEQSASATPRLGILEAYALQRHPDAVALAGEDGAAIAGMLRPRGAARRAGDVAGWAFGLALLAVAGAPLIGMATLMGDQWGIWRLPIEESAPVASVCFAIGAVVQLVALVAWLVRGRRRSPAWRWLSVGTAIVGVVAYAFGNGLASTAGYGAWAGWSAPIVVAIVLAAVSAGLHLLLSRPAEPAPDPVDAAPAAPAGAPTLGEALAAIAPEDRAAALADRDAAIAVLERRGLIEAERAAEARRAPLGGLHALPA